MEGLRPIARARGVTLPQLAMNWVLSDPAITVGLTGPRKVSEIEDTLGAIDWELTPAELGQIAEVMKGAGRADRRAAVFERAEA